jgi:hypothetical protein
LGLIVSAMVSPSKVLAFLDVASPSWDPSLVLVLVSAVIVAALGSHSAEGALPRFSPLRSTDHRTGPLMESFSSAPPCSASDGALSDIVLAPPSSP